MSELQRLLSTGSHLPVDSSVAGMSAGIAECNPTPQLQASTNTQGTILPCSFYGCKQTFSNMQQLSSHVESHKIPTQSLPGKAFRCSALSCSGTFPSMQHLMEHMRHHYKPNHYFLCESCRAKLRSYRALFKHLHTCAKVAKSKAAREEITSPGAMTMTETAETAPAYEAAAPAGQSFSSRILWEHTRGRYSCLQCGHSTPTRQEMTAHIEGQHRSPAGRAQTDTDNRGSPPFQPKISLETETAVYTQL